MIARMASPAHRGGPFKNRSFGQISWIGRMLGCWAVTVFALYSGQQRCRGFILEPTFFAITDDVAGQTFRVFILMRRFKRLERARVMGVAPIQHRLGMAGFADIGAGEVSRRSTHPEER